MLALSELLSLSKTVQAKSENHESSIAIQGLDSETIHADMKYSLPEEIAKHYKLVSKESCTGSSYELYKVAKHSSPSSKSYYLKIYTLETINQAAELHDALQLIAEKQKNQATDLKYLICIKAVTYNPRLQ